MSSLEEWHPMTIGEWIEFEESNPFVRHELVNGEVYAMTDGSKAHNVLSGNIFSACRPAALADDCRIYMSDVKLQVGPNGFYPDVMVSCGADEGNPVLERDPGLVVEVLSPSTARTDKTEKLAAYTAIETLEAYLVAEPNIVRIEVDQRLDGEWNRFVAGAGDTI